jgi:hypothetical protein
VRGFEIVVVFADVLENMGLVFGDVEVNVVDALESAERV